MPKKNSKKCDRKDDVRKCSCGHCDCENEPAYQVREVSTEDGKTYRRVNLGASVPKAKKKETSESSDEATKALMRGMGFNV
jgi:hypothetical protein